MGLLITPITLNEANEFVEKYHRHHKPVVGHKFSIGAEQDGQLVGVCIVGRPVARNVDNKKVVEVTRLCTNGTKNVCSFLYSASARISKEMGYKQIQTYILESELGTSLKASGWELLHISKGKQWKYYKTFAFDDLFGKNIFTINPHRRTDQPTCNKKLFIRQFA
tara:strand:+ start:93 stop:587 length:495 start_codon:yes stop_codon:yes gene_type:complete